MIKKGDAKTSNRQEYDEGVESTARSLSFISPIIRRNMTSITLT